MRRKYAILFGLGLAATVAAQGNDEPPVALLPSSGSAGTGAQLLDGAQQGIHLESLRPAGQGQVQTIHEGSADAAAPQENAAPAATAPQTLVLPQGTISTASLASAAQAPAWSGYQAAESLAANGNPDLALKQLEARLATAPDDAKAAYLKGLILMQLGRGEDAERWFKMMQSNFPNLPQPYNALAVIYSGRKDWPAAQQVLEALLKIDPKHHNARLNLANVHLQLARIQYEEALKHKPNDAMLKQKLQQLDGLQK